MVRCVRSSPKAFFLYHLWHWHDDWHLCGAICLKINYSLLDLFVTLYSNGLYAWHSWIPLHQNAYSFLLPRTLMLYFVFWKFSYIESSNSIRTTFLIPNKFLFLLQQELHIIWYIAYTVWHIKLLFTKITESKQRTYCTYTLCVAISLYLNNINYWPIPNIYYVYISFQYNYWLVKSHLSLFSWQNG